ncbi:MAG TPA: nuclear transport factor 2 family protein [Gemmatimonadales bacterium]|nr:nuclear transport factor 2 family protein [Gemmatimonadales bacterium]
MTGNTEVIAALYAALSRRDAPAMAACYAPDATFSDPVFVGLQGAEVSAMWRMLCERATDFRVECRDIRASGDAGAAHWEAWYSFSATGRQVHNVIEATFEFRDGLIVRHVDRFDLHRWARQALGPAGWLLGWTPPMQAAIRRKAAAGLRRAMGR